MSREPLIQDGIICYHPEIADDHADYHVLGLQALYQAERSHFWFVTRRERILQSLQRWLPGGKSILEIGAGTGYVAEGLQQAGYQVAVGDIHLSGLRYAREKGIERCYQFDLFDTPFSNEFDAIGLFDVLEHLDADQSALVQVGNMLKAGGVLAITVPAHQWLWSREDKIACHKRRYTRQGLQSVVEAAGFEVLEVSYFFRLIVPLLWLRTKLRPDHAGAVTTLEQQIQISLSPVLNTMLLTLTRLENKLAAWLPDVVGGSLVLLAKKSV